MNLAVASVSLILLCIRGTFRKVSWEQLLFMEELIWVGHGYCMCNRCAIVISRDSADWDTEVFRPSICPLVNFTQPVFDSTYLKTSLKVSDILNSITMLIKLTTIKLSGLMLIHPVNKSSVMSRMSFLCLFCSLFVFKLRQCETLKINRIKFHHLKINLKMVNAGKQSWE